MTPERRQLLQQSWTRLAPDADRLAALFYARLFELAPERQALFAQVDMAAQGRKLQAMLADIVRVLDDPDRLVPELAALGRRHTDYGVVPADYDVVGQAMLAMLEGAFGDAFTDELRDAWREAYGLISRIMIRATERRLSAEQKVGG